MLSDIRGAIDRRLLVNYRVDPAAAARFLPEPFRPLLVDDAAVAGICLIRLVRTRPRFTPAWAGLRSENAAHRVAVRWDTAQGPRSGVYIPRRDSGSWVNVLLGGRVYPGEHHRADFDVVESAEEVQVAFTARDGSAHADVKVRIEGELEGSRLFPDVGSASAFFAAGSMGYSATQRPGSFDGLELKTSAWKVEPASVIHAYSSFFSDGTAFPPGSAELDSALIMRKVPVVWEPKPTLQVSV